MTRSPSLPAKAAPGARAVRFGLAILLALPCAAVAQTPVPTAVGDTSIFAPLSLPLYLLPAPSETRSASGAPGHKYWQNRADYALRARLDTSAKTVYGGMTLRYTNHSPDTLRFIWFQMEQNAYRPGSLNTLVFAQDSRFGGRDFKGGYVIESLSQVVGGKKVASHVSDTSALIARLDLVRPLAPGQTATIEAAWHFAVPEHGSDRMGREDPLYEIAQWYPRVAVYDDVRGWNDEPYIGQGEFYLEYGDYTLDVTVPAGYVVAATGMLQNPQQVLTAAQRERLAKAKTSRATVRIITADELKSGVARPTKTGTLTWRFASKNVRDAVWVASPDYQWDACSWKGSLGYAYYRTNAPKTWSEAADETCMSIQEYSERWFQYPYPQMSAVEGPVSGMEYPMLIMESDFDSKYSLYSVITHEAGHSWFPMIVGSNERVSAWQDEGFNTFVNEFSEARRYPEQGSRPQLAAQQRRSVEKYMTRGSSFNMLVNPDRIPSNQLGMLGYTKPAVGLDLLRDEILGPAVFDTAFRTYVRRWAYKHPTPGDFFRTMEDVSGRRLDWFWRGWFAENAQYDQAIDTVTTRAEGSGQAVAVRYANLARGVLPIHVRFTLTDGSTQDFAYPAEVWSTNTRSYVRHYTFSKPVSRIDLDPDGRLVDVNRGNNTWQAPK